MADKPFFSTIICTYDRYGLLSAAIDSLLCQDIGADEYEIIVVDNSPEAGRSTAIAEKYGGRSNFHYVFEQNPGLSNARNVGARLARGSILAYLDDDAIASPLWLRELRAAYQAFGEDAAIVGGPVEPIWPGPPPKWMSRELQGFFSIVDLGNECRELHPREWLAGCNFSARHEALLAVGGFADDLGRKGTLSLLSNEETRVSELIRLRGGKIVYAPRAGVRHHIDPVRSGADWLKRRIAWQAVSDVLSQPEEALKRAAIASDRFAKYTHIRRGLFFSNLLRRRNEIKPDDLDRIYQSILVLLSRGS